ncbi:MAG: hypothetical protein IJR86_06845 [Bacteroidaceae bacterium]|nr:hypothetical protein [Bacteroidaceae bacterium]MBR6140538.1 hypothetical protein [Bacteroidaceae bacterium]
MAEKAVFQQFDRFGDGIWSTTFDWRDERVMKYIRAFIQHGKIDSKKNIHRLNAILTGRLVRSIGWKAWSESGGDAEVFQETYLKYGQFVELAVGGIHKYKPIDPITHRAWQPIPVAGRRRKAKPHSTAEMRKQARKFERLLVEHFSYVGLGFLVYAAGANRENYKEINRLMGISSGNKTVTI